LTSFIDENDGVNNATPLINPRSPGAVLLETIISPDEGSPAYLALQLGGSSHIDIPTEPIPAKEIRKNTRGKSIDKDHESYHLTYGMMCGIRTSVSMANQDEMKLLDWDFMTVDNYVFAPSGSVDGGPGGKPTPPHHLPYPFKFKDYAPLVFRGLRKRFGIDPSDYLCDLCGDFNYIEFLSNSKSGQFFFYSYK
jgi:hypothetical protein